MDLNQILEQGLEQRLKYRLEIKNEFKSQPMSLARSNDFGKSVSSFQNEELITHFNQLVRTERKITQDILECIVEIDRRKIYLSKAYPSLFEFLVKEFGYSPSSAMRRIESARLLREIPEVSEKIKTGAINLSQLSKMQQTFRAVQKISNVKVQIEQKKDILNKIEFSTQAKTELILAQEFNLPTLHFEKEKVHKDESITLTITFTKEQMDLLEKTKNLISHSVAENKWADVFTYLARKEIKARTPKVNIEKITSESKILDKKQVINVDPIKTEPQETIALSLRKKLLNPKTASCQFKDLRTQKVCGHQKFLQLDHIEPRWAGGQNQISNLQVLCSEHNRYRYKTQAGLLP